MAKRTMPADFKVLVGMILALVIPFALTLLTIRQPRAAVSDLSTNPSPYGYTLSLSLFIIPVIVLATWQSLRKENRIQKKAFWITAILVAGCGIMLDIFFGLTFFTFENRQATLGINFWGFTFDGDMKRALPVEEIAFYFFGTVVVLLIYVWGDEYWFGAYNRDDGPRRETRVRQMVSFHPWSAIFGVVIFGIGCWYKKFGPHQFHQGFPGYFLFLTVVATTPSILLFPSANPYINWRAFSLGFCSFCS
jgi:hypothetical protein